MRLCASTFDRDVAERPPRRVIRGFVDVADEIALERRRVAGPVLPQALALQAVDMQSPGLRQTLGERRVRGIP
jgi:hypothetical protein